MVASIRTAIDDARASAVPTSDALPNAHVVFALARIEAKHLLRHPAFLVTIGFSFLLLRGALGTMENTGVVEFLGWLAGGIALGTLIGTVLTANVAALRPRRDQMRELYGSLPAPPETLTAAVLVGLVMGIGAVAVVVAAVAWFVLKQDDDLRDFVDLFMAVQYVLAVMALGAMGVAVARWIPSVLGGPLVVIVHVFTGLIWIVPWIATRSSGISVGWHIVYLASVTVGWVALAFARDRGTPARFVVAAVALGLGLLAAVQQVPPGGYS
jgi:hypothetical protein